MSVISHVAGYVPPPVRRTLSGLWLDLRSVPARLRDPARRSEPWQMLHNVGGGDYAEAGRHTLALLKAHAGLTPHSRVLDIGCGTGRMAWPLAQYLGPDAAYVGFDVSPRAIADCRRRIGPLRPDFSFLEADVANGEYRAGGQVEEAAYGFPPGDNVMDVAFAMSVFSHMRLSPLQHYFREACRVLAPGGRFMFTAYALTPDRLAALARGEGRQPFRPWRDGAYVIDPRSPERAIAHPLEEIRRACLSAGFGPHADVRLGGWLGPADYDGGQDLFVVRKPLEATAP